MTKKVLISVWNKDKIVEFAEELTQKYDYEIVSEGSTYDLLKENNIKAKNITENFSDILDKKENFTCFNIVIINFYPFDETANKQIDEIKFLDNIDIKGHALLRAAAKYNKNILAVSSPSQYKEVLADLEEHDGTISLKLRRKFALIAFEKTIELDTKILHELSDRYEEDTNNYFSLNLKKAQQLCCGENSHQNANMYITDNTIDYELINGKELSYNNFLDCSVCTNILSEFYDVNAGVIIKHNTPCGVALGRNIEEAWEKALDCDPLSAIGGIVGFSQTVNENLARSLNSMYLQAIISVDYSKEAIEILKQNKNLRIIKLNTSLEEYKNYLSSEIKITPFGTLVQDYDKGELNKDNFKVVTKTKPAAEMVEDMIFAWKIAKHAKSNAIVIAKNFKTLGIAQGHTNRVDAFETALNRACDGSKDAVAASDGVLFDTANINAAAQGRIAGIIQPGGSIKDNDIIKVADKYNISMITTGIRHLRH